MLCGGTGLLASQILMRERRNMLLKPIRHCLFFLALSVLGVSMGYGRQKSGDVGQCHIGLTKRLVMIQPRQRYQRPLREMGTARLNVRVSPILLTR